MEERAQAAQEPQAASLESGFRWREHVVDMREKLGPSFAATVFSLLANSPSG